MANLYICPFYTSEDPMVIRCEAGSLRFPTRRLWNEYRLDYCGNHAGYEYCTLATMLLTFYDEGGIHDEPEEREEADMDADVEGRLDPGAGEI